MKEIRNIFRYGFFALCAFMPASCAEESEWESGGLQKWPVLFTAEKEMDTKISVSGTAVSWEDTDKLKLTAVASDGEVATADVSLFEKTDAHTASFTGYVSMISAPQACYFTYPLGAAMSVDASTGKIKVYYNLQDGKHKPFLYARTPYDSDGISAAMTHVGAMLEIDVQIEGASQLSFAGNQLEYLSPVIVNPETAVAEVSSSESNMQITVPVQASGKTYIAVPPVNFTKGFSLICSNADGSESMIKTFSTDGGLSSGYDFTDKAGQIIPVVLTGTFENFSVSCSSPTIVHTRTDAGLLNGTSASFVMTKQGSSDKLIEEWGATLVNPDGMIVREISYTNADPIKGQTVIMNIANDWILLSGGTYTFTPYYKIYGQKISLASQSVEITDPGVTLTVAGQTSYDKYLAGNTDGANAHAYNLMEGVKVSTNIDLGILSNYLATLDGADPGSYAVTSDALLTADYGNITRDAFKTYPFMVSFNVGPLAFSASKDFHITGLPMEAVFNSNPTGWSPAWGLYGNIKYNDDGHITYTTGGSGGLRSPGFHIPGDDIIVKTAFDACGRNVDFMTIDSASYRDIYYVGCPSTQSSVVFGTSCVRAEYKVTYSESGYLDWSANMTLTPAKSAVMYSANSNSLYTKAFYKAKIHYSK